MKRTNIDDKAVERRRGRQLHRNRKWLQIIIDYFSPGANLDLGEASSLVNEASPKRVAPSCAGFESRCLGWATSQYTDVVDKLHSSFRSDFCGGHILFPRTVAELWFPAGRVRSPKCFHRTMVRFHLARKLGTSEPSILALSLWRFGRARHPRSARRHDRCVYKSSSDQRGVWSQYRRRYFGAEDISKTTAHELVRERSRRRKQCDHSKINDLIVRG